jgi:hypothetical protein
MTDTADADLIARAYDSTKHDGETNALLRELADRLATQDKINAALREALQQLLDGYLAHWMAARAEIEGTHMSAHLFNKEFDVIAARAALALTSGEQP